jgi:hypothetical protein
LEEEMTSAKAWVSAIFAALSAGLASLAVVLVGDQTLSDLSQAQWLAVGIAAFTAFSGGFGFTWATSNKPAASSGDVVAEIGRRLGDA